jgi:8-oxo-(d)GTP phosphatase
MSTEETQSQIEAAGGLLWRVVDGQPQLAVVHRPRYDDWSLPKGKVEPGESFETAAVREVQEETGCSARLGMMAGTLRYLVDGFTKEVRFWHMDVEGECQFISSPEVDQLAWLSIPDALRKLDYPGERAILRASRRYTSAAA